ncbi:MULTISPECIES: hypothetical protein [unclassified Streptomyces]|uniref:hypothetical protein n=1 Tax=unclassified Streptomyces TaxID=2593676 RepID=UPI00340EE8EE
MDVEESFVQLCELKRAVEAARESATAGPYSAEAWRPWVDAAETFQRAVTEHATAHGLNRYDVEAAVKKAVLHPEGDEG